MYLPLHGVCTFKCVLEMLLFKDLPMQTLLVSNIQSAAGVLCLCCGHRQPQLWQRSSIDCGAVPGGGHLRM